MKNMFRHILVPLDFTPKNEAAMDATIRLAQQEDSHVSLLHVIETIDYIESDELKDFYDTLEVNAWKNMDAFAARLANENVNHENDIRFGKRAREIVQFAIDHDVDLVVLSSHKVDLRQPTANLGTVSHQVSILCQCPVLMVK